ncbi:MAG: F0F1 ATP synthase subunit epsilon [Anaerolineae bacterium]
MPEPIRLTVVMPAQKLLEAEGVAWVQASLADGGPIGIYPGHAPLLAETVTAPLRYADASGEHTIDLNAGILQVSEKSVTVFTDNQTRGGVQSYGLPETSRVSMDDRHFDRLAQELLATLNAQPNGVLNNETE